MMALAEYTITTPIESSTIMAPNSHMSGLSLRGIDRSGGERAPLLPQTPPPLSKHASAQPLHEAAEDVAAVDCSDVGGASAAPPHTPHRFERAGRRGQSPRSNRVVGHAGHASPCTRPRKTSPRCSKLSNMSKEAQAGDSS